MQTATSDAATLRERFHRDGFVVIAEPVVSDTELGPVVSTIDTLLATVDSLPAEFVHDLSRGDAGGGQIVEIIRLSELAPELRHTAAYRRLRHLAEEVLGTVASPTFDHTIHKPPRNQSATAWHQDVVYSGEVDEPPAAVTIWLALQDTPIERGSMRFVPGSHQACLPHRQRGGDPTAWALEAIGVDESAAVSCPVAKGGVTLHHPAVLHATGPNETSEVRRAWIVQFRPASRRGIRRLLPRAARHWLDAHRVVTG